MEWRVGSLGAGLLLLAGCLTAPTVPRDDCAAVGEDYRLQGTWMRVSATCGREKIVDWIPVRVMISGHSFDLIQRNGQVLPGTYTADLSRNPKTIDIVTTVRTARDGGAVESRQETRRGIYEVTGDSLSICEDISGAGRPTKFCTSAAGQRRFLLSVYRRE